jgi:unsaturated chondroitin disaccharide hydrolase
LRGFLTDRKVKLQNKERFLKDYTISRDKLLFAAYQHNLTTEKLLIREDGSSFHHYQFDPVTAKPVRGITFQGYSDTSCWSRGHSWGVYGFPIAYDYTKDESLMAVHKDVVAFMLNNLPKDNVLYWDYDFTDGSGEPRDTSANIISACGLLEAIKFMDDDAPEKEIYKNAAMIMIEAVIDGYTGDIGEDYDGLLWGATGARKMNLCIDGCAPYADYFYLEALLRLKKPDWKRYW